MHAQSGNSGTIADKLMQRCPEDLSCVIGRIQESPRIPGNIAVIVQLLHNISTVLLTGVDEAKMQVSYPKYFVEHHYIIISAFPILIFFIEPLKNIP